MKLSDHKSAFAAAALIVVGCAQMAGDLTGFVPLKAIAAATGASPAPKVFTAHQGFETYSSNFFISWADKDGKSHSVQLTPEVYRGLKGPYNRRNAYGAALAYAPVLHASQHTRPMHAEILNYTFCGESTALQELGIGWTPAAGPIFIRLEPRQELPADHTWKLNYEVTCDD